MANYFTDNPDLVSHFENLDLEELVSLNEKQYTEAERYRHAPTDYQDALDSYRRVLQTTGDIAAEFIAPRAAAVDLEGNELAAGQVRYAEGTRQALQRLAQAELMGMTLPRQFGGLNLPLPIYIMSIEIVSRADASLMNIYGLQDIAETIADYGSDEQRREFLPMFSSGKCTGAMALTEPDAGSDLQAVKLQAIEQHDGSWRLRGVKRFITNGCGDVLLVLARSEPGTKDARGLSLFVCRGDETVTIRRLEHKLGIHGSPTCELQFDDTPAQIVGRRKLGLIRYVMDLMNGARLGVAAQALGIAQAAYEEAMKYARVRKQFGKQIAEIPVVSDMLISMRVQLESNRSLLYATAKWAGLKKALEREADRLRSVGRDFSWARKRAKEATTITAVLTPITKYVLSESANEIAYKALQVHGGAGYMKEFPIERLVRDARITSIYEGTSQMQIVAAMGGVMKDALAGHLGEDGPHGDDPGLEELEQRVAELHALFLKSRKAVVEADSNALSEVAAEGLVQMYAGLYVGNLLIAEAHRDERKRLVARRHILESLGRARRQADAIQDNKFADLQHAETILS